MILSGSSIVRNGILKAMRSVAHQQQPCGVDLTLKSIHHFTSPATIDFDNSHRRAADTSQLQFCNESKMISLTKGVYRVNFNETIDVPLDCMGQLFTRSSLWRSGVSLHAGLVDAGYKGGLGALMMVDNLYGVVLCENAKLGQITVLKMEGEVEGYNGVYQTVSNTGERPDR